MNPCNFPVLDLWFHIKHHRFLHTLKSAGTSHELHVLYSCGSQQGTEQLNIEISRERILCRNSTNTANSTMSTVAVPVLFTGQYNFRGWQLQIMIFSLTFQSHLKKDVLHNEMHQLGLGCIVWEPWFAATKAKQSQCHTGMLSQV